MDYVPMQHIVDRIFSIYLGRVKTRGWVREPVVPFETIQKATNVPPQELRTILDTLAEDGLMWEWNGQSNDNFRTHRWGLTMVDDVYETTVYCERTRQMLARQ